MKQPRDELSRLRNLLAWAFLATLILIVGIVAYFTYELSDAKDKAENIATQVDYNTEHITKLESEAKVPGSVGKSGANGIDGKNGENAVSKETVIVKQVPVNGQDGAKGDKGDQGEPGSPGRVIFIRTNPLTSLFECRYAGDLSWLPEAECR